MTNETEIVRGAQRRVALDALPVAPGLAFDALHVRGSRPTAAGGAWYDAFALDRDRIVLCAGDLPGRDAAIAAAATREMRELFAAGVAPSVTTDLLHAGVMAVRGRCVSDNAGAIVGIVDCREQTFTYVIAGQAAPLIRYHDGSVARLPPAQTSAECAQADLPAARTVVDLRGASLLLLYTNGLVRTTRTIDVGMRRLGHVLDDDRIVHCTSPTAWIARRMLDDRSHDDVALLAALLSPRAATIGSTDRPRWTVSWSFEATGATSNAARRAFVECLTSKATTRAPIDCAAAELIFGELLGNVVRHAPGRVDVTLDWSGELPVLHVRDNGAGYRLRPRHEQRPAELLSEYGRGLFIVNACATSFHVRAREGGGTHATVTLPAAAP